MGLFDFIGDMVGAASSYKAAKYAADSNAAMNAQNIALQQQTNAQQMMMFQDQRADTEKYFNVARDDTRYYHESNIAAQERAAQNAIQWRVQDAIKAGVHPVYAMGNPGIATSPTGAFTSPQSAAAPPNLVAPQVSGSAGDASFVAHMGQAIGRAVGAMQTKEERVYAKTQVALATARDKLSLERGMLENDLIRSEIARNNRADQAGPPAPSVAAVPEFSMGNSPRSARVDPRPATPTVNAPGVPSREAGNITDWGYSRTPTGLVVVQSADSKQRTEDDLLAQLGWMMRNNILPMFDPDGVNRYRPSTREFPLPEGQEWRYDFWSGEYRPGRARRRN